MGNSTLRPFCPRERPGTHCRRGWVGPGIGLDRCGKLAPTDIRSLDRPARSESLYRLSYPGPRVGGWQVGSCRKTWQYTRIEKDLVFLYFNPLTPNDHYSGPTAPLTSNRCILYIYWTNIGTKYFKHGIYSPFFSLQNAVCFIMYLVSVLFTFYVQGAPKFKKIIPAPKG